MRVARTAEWTGQPTNLAPVACALSPQFRRDNFSSAAYNAYLALCSQPRSAEALKEYTTVLQMTHQTDRLAELKAKACALYKGRPCARASVFGGDAPLGPGEGAGGRRGV